MLRLPSDIFRGRSVFRFLLSRFLIVPLVILGLLLHDQLLHLLKLLLVRRGPDLGRPVMKATLREIVQRAIFGDTGERVGKINPGADQDSSGGQRQTPISQSDQDRQNHAAPGRIPSQDDSLGVEGVQEEEVSGKAVLQAAGERELGGQAVPRREDARLELAGMALHLVAVLVDAAEEVGAAVDVEHDPVATTTSAAGIGLPLALVVVGPHLNPLRLELGATAARLAPLPPFAAPDLADALGPELVVEETGGARQQLLADDGLLDLDPGGMRDPLRGECLELLDGVFGGVL